MRPRVEQVAAVLWLMLAAVLVGASIGLAAKAYGFRYVYPGVGEAAGIGVSEVGLP